MHWWRRLHPRFVCSEEVCSSVNQQYHHTLLMFGGMEWQLRIRVGSLWKRLRRSKNVVDIEGSQEETGWLNRCPANPYFVSLAWIEIAEQEPVLRAVGLITRREGNRQRFPKLGSGGRESIQTQIESFEVGYGWCEEDSFFGICLSGGYEQSTQQGDGYRSKLLKAHCGTYHVRGIHVIWQFPASHLLGLCNCCRLPDSCIQSLLTEPKNYFAASHRGRESGHTIGQEPTR
jgi:hypothetical protein